METGSYKELQSKAKTSTFVAVLITSVTLMLCLLIGIGTWILVAGSSNNAIPVTEGRNVIEEVVIVETIEPEQTAKIIQNPSEIDFTEGRANSLDTSILEEVEDSIRQEGEVASRMPFRPANSPFIQSLVELSNNVASEIFSKFAESGRFADIFNQSGEEEEETHNRERRSLPLAMGLNAIKYLNYLSFGKFMFNEVYSITEYAVEGRKLSGDSDAFFLDNGFWSAPEKKKSSSKIAQEKADEEEILSAIVAKPNRPPSAFDDGWTPMVNKVSLKFITDMLTTLLNLMREYLMRDNVMECLWFMFCKDMNHQAKYQDPMGYLARVNR